MDAMLRATMRTASAASCRQLLILVQPVDDEPGSFPGVQYKQVFIISWGAPKLSKTMELSRPEMIATSWRLRR